MNSTPTHKTKQPASQPKPVQRDFIFGGGRLEISIEPIMGTPYKARQLSITLFSRWSIWVSGWINFTDLRRK